MIECIQGIFSLLAQYVNWFFSLQIDLSSEVNISIGELVTIFLFVVLALYILLSAIGVINNSKEGGEGDDSDS